MMIEERDGGQNLVDSSKLFQKSQTDFMTMIEEEDGAYNLVDNKKWFQKSQTDLTTYRQGINYWRFKPKEKIIKNY